LNIVYNLIVKQFGGTITVASTLDQGTHFTVRIPRVTPQESLGALQASPAVAVETGDALGA
jgi:two-component system NtrC family sensor kinase